MVNRRLTILGETCHRRNMSSFLYAIVSTSAGQIGALSMLE
jgi:hypothetical protein